MGRNDLDLFGCGEGQCGNESWSPIKCRDVLDYLRAC